MSFIEGLGTEVVIVVAICTLCVCILLARVVAQVAATLLPPNAIAAPVRGIPCRRPSEMIFPQCYAGICVVNMQAILCHCQKAMRCGKCKNSAGLAWLRCTNKPPICSFVPFV